MDAARERVVFLARFALAAGLAVSLWGLTQNRSSADADPVRPVHTGAMSHRLLLFQTVPDPPCTAQARRAVLRYVRDRRRIDAFLARFETGFWLQFHRTAEGERILLAGTYATPRWWLVLKKRHGRHSVTGQVVDKETLP